MSQEEGRIKALEIEQALLKQKLEHNSVSDAEFKDKVVKDLDYLKERDIKVMDYIESQLEKEEDAKEIRQAIKAKLATSGVWGAIILLCSIGWYAFTNWIQYLIHSGAQ